MMWPQTRSTALLASAALVVSGCLDDRKIAGIDDSQGSVQPLSPSYSAAATNATFTTAADFQRGTLINLSTSGDGLAQGAGQVRPFIWVAASGRGTIVRINVNTGDVVGEYWTSPNPGGRNPSRTTVDLYGNVWTGNRNEGSSIGGVPHGSVVKIGLIEGGQRVDASGSPDANGEYVKPPFGYNTCIDRNSDGLIRTSRGLGHILAWNNSTDLAGSTDGAAHGARVQDADDECILVFQRVSDAENVRHLSVDSNNDVWVGGYPFAVRSFHRLHETTGVITSSFNARNIPDTGGFAGGGCGGYGGLIDRNNVLWSASLSQGRLLRYDLNSGTGTCIIQGDSYGLGIDGNGHIWNGLFWPSHIAKYSPAGALQAGFPKPTGGGGASRGVTVSADNNVWVANTNSHNVSRLDNNGNILAVISVGSCPTGVAVDANGKVWATNLCSDNVSRIDPTTNTVDLTVPLGGGAGPYNYSDMTGRAVLGGGGAVLQGSWSIVHDGGSPGIVWNGIRWNSEPEGSQPPGTEIIVEARAADSEAALASLPFIRINSTASASRSPSAPNEISASLASAASSLTGRFIEVRVTMRGSAGGAFPVLSDLTILSGPTYSFTGFFSPVENKPAWNRRNGGSTVPIKFGLGGNQGMNVLAPGAPVSRQINCSTKALTGPEQRAEAPGKSGLSYNANDQQYQLNWKTEKGWEGTCREYVLRLSDGSEHTALFNFR